MSFLTPWVAAGLAAIAIPALVLLYFLKLRRRPAPITSTLLWRRAVEDLQVNAPFQRLRRNLLLLLQLLVLAAALLALARPVIQTIGSEDTSLVLLIDRSASMNVVGSDGLTRLDRAKEQAIARVRSVNRTGSSWFRFFGAQATTRAMVISYADRARVVAPFTTNTGDLVASISDIRPSDGTTNLDEALELAEASTAQVTYELAPDTANTGSRLLVFSDGGIPAEGLEASPASPVEWIPVADDATNVAITGFTAERDPERPELVRILAEVRSFGPDAVETDVSLLIDGRLTDVKRRLVLGEVDAADADRSALESPTGSAARSTEARASGEPDQASPLQGAASAFAQRETIRQVKFTPPAIRREALLQVSLSRPDALQADNDAWLVLPAPKIPQVLLVSPEGSERFFVEVALRSNLALDRAIDDDAAQASLTVMTPAAYEAASDAQLIAEGRSRFDVVVFDRHSTERLPRGNYLFLGGIPQIDGFEAEPSAGAQTIEYWNDTDSLLRYVSLEYVEIFESQRLTLPPAAEIVAESSATPLIARFRGGGRSYVITSFAPGDSDMPLQNGLYVFLQNSLQFLAGTGAIARQLSYAPGQAVAVQVDARSESPSVQFPDETRVVLTPGPSGIDDFSGAERVGLYRVDGAAPGSERFAVNLLDATESDVRPPAELTVGGQAVARGEVLSTTTPEIWRWLVGGVLVLLMIEWSVYNRRVLA